MKKILIVDDLRTYIERQKSILSRSDFRIFTAQSSEEALALHKIEKVDLLIVDMDMPVNSGDRLCSIIRNDENLKQVSVILVCNNSAADISRAGRCKANAYITKPIHPVEFLEKVGQLLDIPARKSYRVLLKVTVNGMAGSESFFCSSQNISFSGILIETEKAFEKGRRISCSFFLPNSERIITDGEIVRSVKKSETMYQYGVRYVDLAPKYRAAIDEF